VIAVVNKIDRVHPRERLLPYIGRLAERAQFLAIVPLSALRADNIEALRREILAALQRVNAFIQPDRSPIEASGFALAS